MQKKPFIAVLALAGLASLGLVRPAAAEDKGIIALQQSMTLLLSQVQDLQKSLNTSMGMMQGLVSQNTDTVNKLSAAVAALQQSLAGDRVVASQRQNDLGKDFQAVNDAIADLKNYMSGMNKTLEQVHQLQQTVPAPAPANPGAPSASNGATAPGTPGGASPAAGQYNSALLDFQSGNPAAQAELAAFIRANPSDPQVPDAMYYLGTIFMQKQQYNEAVDNFSSVITQFPDNPKASMAELNKGISLYKRGDRAAAISELKALAKNYPGTEAARQADIELKSLGAGRGR